MKILLSTLTALLLLGCSGDDQSAHQKTASTPKTQTESAPAPVADMPEAPAEAMSAPEAVPATQEIPAVDTAIQSVKAEAETVVNEASAAVTTASAPGEGAVMFKQKCATCHGQMAEKHALNTSQIIAGWEKEKIMKALHGYKDGSYGGPMKGMMQGQVKALSDEDIEMLAEHISSL